jgi:hypothetical protein
MKYSKFFFNFIAFFFFFPFFVGLGFELRALHLQSKSSAPLTTPPVHFALVFSKMGSQEQFT